MYNPEIRFSLYRCLFVTGVANKQANANKCQFSEFSDLFRPPYTHNTYQFIDGHTE